MGIKGLLPALNGVERNITVDDLRNLTVGIDAYVWLHRGSYSCVLEIFQNKRTTKYVDYCVRQIKYLQNFNIKPYFVFDGGLLPKKGGTEENRNNIRNENREKGFEYLKLGQRNKAYDCFKKSVDVTPYMAYQLIKELRKMNIDFVVAPYEADAQLAYLEKIGLIQAIITEDSDLLVFGCKRVIYKWTKEGTGSEICRDRFKMCRGMNLNGWNDEMFRHMCILSGCDYLPNIPKVGIKRAYNLVKQKRYIKNILFEIKQRFDLNVPPDYEQQFIEADKTFLYQRVFDPIKNELVTLNPVPNELNLEDMEYIGPLLEKEIAEGVAKGDLNPFTKEPNSNELVDPHYKDILKQINSEESSSSNNSNEPLKNNKLFRPSQIKVTMNSNKVNFLTNASAPNSNDNKESIVNNRKQRKNNSSLFKKYQKNNEEIMLNQSKPFVQEKINNNITEITIIDNIDDIANSSDIEIDVGNNKICNQNNTEKKNINLISTMFVDDIFNSSDNENNDNINQNEIIEINDSMKNTPNNNNIISKSNFFEEFNSSTIIINDDKDNSNNTSYTNQIVMENNNDSNNKASEYNLSSENVNNKNIKPVQNNTSKPKINTLDRFFSKSSSFSEFESSFSSSSTNTNINDSSVSSIIKSTDSSVNIISLTSKSVSSSNSENNNKSVVNTSISSFFISNKQKKHTTPKFNRHHSYPVIKIDDNNQELNINNQKMELKNYFDSPNKNSIIIKDEQEVSLNNSESNSNDNSINLSNNSQITKKDDNKNSNVESKSVIVIDDIQDSDIEESNSSNNQSMDNKSAQTTESESNPNDNLNTNIVTENIINQNNENNEKPSSNLNQNTQNNILKNKLRSLLNRNNILLKKSASISKTSPYFTKKSNNQTNEEMNNNEIESNPIKQNKMIVDEPAPLYISDNENENNNKLNEDSEIPSTQVYISQSSNSNIINSSNEDEEKKLNSSNKFNPHSRSYLFNEKKGDSFSSNSSFLNIFDSFTKSDNEDDILPDIDYINPNENANDDKNTTTNTQSSTTTQNHSLSNDDTNSGNISQSNNSQASSVNISEIFHNFNSNSLKRKRDELIHENSRNKNFMDKANFSEDNTIILSQISSHSEELNASQPHKNINLILREKFAYNKNIETKNKSTNQILTQSLMNSLPSYNLNSSVKASNAYIAPKMNKKKNIKRKTHNSSSILQKKKEKENQKIEVNQLENPALHNYLFEKFKYKE